MGAFKIDKKGIGEILKSGDVRKALHKFADPAAQTARAMSGMDVETEDYETDRAAVSIAITDPAGMAEQAKHGTLTRAAGSVGLEVKAKP